MLFSNQKTERAPENAKIKFPLLYLLNAITVWNLHITVYIKYIRIYIYIYTYKHIYINNGVLGVHDPLRISYLKPDYKITLRNIMSKPQDKMFKKDDTAYCTITEVLI